MALKSGTRLGSYEITAPLGAGGMGEVYRATDTKLKRDVAIKILPEEVSRDRDRLARFEREAHVLASLNHPHIAGIYGLEESDGVPCLVLELVEGQTLAEKLKEGGLPVEKALELARQIASALEAAHEKGIIHRDLKPANIKLTPEGSAKVLDFGLAKALADESTETSGDASRSPTLTAAATRAGVILGTAAYMSPEQARGKRVDKRTDVWAFGCVFYEMLTGRQAFPGETASDAIARILEHDPDWQALPAKTPLKIRELLRRCLTKEHRDRLHDIADARIEIQEVLADPLAATTKGLASPARVPIWRRALPWALAASLAVALTVVTWVHLVSTSGSAGPATHVSILLPPEVRLQTNWHALALSPDGRLLAMVVDHGGVNQIFLRDLGKTEAVPLAGTEGGNSPFFSPDGKWVGFRHDVEGSLKKVPVEGGTPIVIIDDVWGRGSAWGRDGYVIFPKEYLSGLWRVPAAGGTPEMLTAPEAEEGEWGHHWPQLLPGGREIVYTSTHSSPELTRIMALSLETGERKTLVEGAYFGRYAPTGHLLYMKREILYAVPFDPETLETRGTAVPVLDDVGGLLQYMGHLSLSDTGTLAYIPHSTQYPPRNLVWVDRRGSEEAVGIESRPFANPRVSPDGRRIAASIMEHDTNIWVYELARGTSVRLTDQPTSDEHPIWTRDGRRVIYSRDNVQLDLYWRDAAGRGKEELLHSSDYDLVAWDVSPDGKWLLFSEARPPEEAILVLPLDGEGEATLILDSATEASFSPDGHWVAYSSGRSGRLEVYLQQFPGPVDTYRVSLNGGAQTAWSPDGKELYFLEDRKMMAATVHLGATVEIGKPRVLFESSYDDYWISLNYDVAADGRFLMVKTPAERAPRQVNVVLNWFEELERLVSTP